MGSTEERVRKQIEFYLSDSNLVKDKFLRPLVDQDPEGYVDLSVICGFNRVRAISTNRDEIIKALQKSSSLVLNENGTLIRRKVPYREYDSKARTVYAEDLPKGFDHDVVRELFMKAGKVVFVSLPRFQNEKKDFKGFAFVEYQSEEAAKNAVRYFAELRAKDATAPRVIMRAEWERLTQSFKENWRKQHHQAPAREPARQHATEKQAEVVEKNAENGEAKVGGAEGASPTSESKKKKEKKKKMGDEKKSKKKGKREKKRKSSSEDNEEEAEEPNKKKKKKKSKKDGSDKEESHKVISIKLQISSEQESEAHSTSSKKRKREESADAKDDKKKKKKKKSKSEKNEEEKKRKKEKKRKQELFRRRRGGERGVKKEKEKEQEEG